MPQPDQPQPEVSSRAVRFALGSGALAYAVLCVATFREGHGGGDFALYILHALNIASGRAYADTGFLYEPLNAIMSPAAYPPGFPLLLAPVAALAGPTALAGFKAVVLLTLLGALLAFYALVRPVLGTAMAAVTTAGAGLIPGLFDRRDGVLSDIPSLLWCLLALLLHDRLRRRTDYSWPLVAGLAAAVAMAASTRTAGLAVAGAIMLACLRRQGPWRAAMAATVLGCAAAAVAGRLLRVDNQTYIGYLAALREQGPLGLLRDVVTAYAPGLAGVWGISAGPVGGPVVLGFMLILVLAGWALRVRADAGATEAFLAGYAVLLLVFPVRLEPVRYLVPVAPLLIYYPAVAIRSALATRPAWRAPAAMAMLCALLMVPYYVEHPPTRHRASLVTGPDSQALFAAIRDLTASSDVILAPNPRVLVLMTGRRSAIWPENPGRADLAGAIAHSKAAWAVEDHTSSGASDIKAQALLPGTGARVEWRNDRYSLWRLPP